MRYPRSGLAVAVVAVIVLAFSACVPLQPPARATAAMWDDDKSIEVSTDLPDLLRAHNERRAEKQLSPLRGNSLLAAAAARHARDMAAHDKMSHEGSDGSDPETRIHEAGYYGQRLAENVAEGYKTSDEVLAGWMDSPPHRENILGDFRDMGAARATNPDGKVFWAVEFGRPWPKLDPDQAAADFRAALNRTLRRGRQAVVDSPSQASGRGPPSCPGQCRQGETGSRRHRWSNPARSRGPVWLQVPRVDRG